MASSGKGQNLLVWVIVFVVLTVVSGVTAFLFYQQTTKLTTELAAAKNSKADADKAKAAAEQQVTMLKAKIGYELLTDFGKDGDSLAANTLLGNIANDLTKYVPAPPPGQPPTPPSPSYKDELARLNGNVVALSTERDEKTKSLARLQTDFKTQRDEHEAKVTQFKQDTDAANAGKAEVDAESERRERAYTQREQDTTARANDIARRETQLKQDHEKYVEKNDRMVKKLGNEVEEFKNQMSRIQSAGSPVGAVVTVDNTSRQVYIDRGDAHLLPLQTTFSVWDSTKVGTMFWQDKNKKIKDDAAKEFEDSNRKNFLSPRLESGPKAYIEIVAILGPNQAVGRITMDQVGNPIVPGDQLFSPIWEPGRKRHFALAGRFDMTGKGTNDRTLLKELIKRQGGVIDAEVNDDGTIGGELQDVAVETYMLVKGDLPDPLDATDPLKEFAESIRRASGELESKAKKLAVDIVDQQKFYDYMGYKVHARKYEVGKYAGAPEPKGRFDNPSDTTRPRGFQQEGGASSRQSGIPGLSNKKK